MPHFATNWTVSLINESNFVSLTISYLNDVKCVNVVTESKIVNKRTLNPPTQNNRIKSRLLGFSIGPEVRGRLKQKEFDRWEIYKRKQLRVILNYIVEIKRELMKAC
jgi:hypothetical protein